MKTHTVSLLSVTLFLLGIAGPGNAQASPGPPAVVSQTIRGVTATLTNIQWLPFDPPDGPLTFFNYFHLSVHLSASRELGLPLNKTLLSYVTAISAISPSGHALRTTGGSESRRSSGGVLDKSAYWDNIDPRWPLVGIDVDMVDPAAPPRAVGRSTDPIIITGIPAPIDEKPLTVHAETMTPLGTKVVVEKVEVARHAERNQTTFVFRVIPGPEAPDLRFSFFNDSKVVDDTGARLNPKGGGTGGDGDFTNPQASYERYVYSAAINDIPAPGAKTLTLTLDAIESSEALKQEQWYRHFHLIVPMRLLDSSRRRPHFPLATVQGKGVAITLDSIKTVQSRYRARYTLRDLTGSDLTWRLDAVRGKDEAGNPLTGRISPGTAFFWKIDGSPLAGDEDASEVFLGAADKPSGPFSVAAPKPAKTLLLEVDASAVRFETHLLDFPRTPIPAAGRFLVLNRVVRDASGARLTLRKVGAYAPGYPLPGFELSSLPVTVSPPPSGIVVVLAEPPDPSSPDFDFGVVAANDSLKRHLGEADGLSPFFCPGDVLQSKDEGQSREAGSPTRVRTYFLNTASPGAATFNLRMGHNTVIPLNRHETLVFPAVEAP